MLLLAVAGIIVPFFQRLKLSPVLAYLLAGIFFGPFGLGAVLPAAHPLSFLVLPNSEEVQALSEFGIVFLLFTIGLELSPTRLWKLRQLILGFGTLQIVVTASAFGLILTFLGLDPRSVIIIGGALALSSTAIAMQVLAENRTTATPVGRTSFAVLLCQDLAAVPLLILVGIMGSGGALLPALTEASFKALLSVGFLLILAPLVLRPLFQLASRAAGAEAFFALALLVAISTATLTGMAGLSMALGAFLAGIMLAETEFSRAIESHLLPFKGLLLGVFFMSVGMSINLPILTPNLGYILLAVVGLIALKTALVVTIAPIFRLPLGQALEIGLLLSQAGEFGFVLINIAMPMGLVPHDLGQFTLAVIGLSMLTTPLLASVAMRLSKWIHKNDDALEMIKLSAGLEGAESHVLIAGFGRVGRVISEVLTAENIPWTAIDKNVRVVVAARHKKMPVWYGDLSQQGLLERAGLGKSLALVVTVDDPNSLAHILHLAKRAAPSVPIFARTRDRTQSRSLVGAGATQLLPENVELAFQLSAHVFRTLQMDEDTIQRRLAFLRHEMRILP